MVAPIWGECVQGVPCICAGWLEYEYFHAAMLHAFAAVHVRWGTEFVALAADPYLRWPGPTKNHVTRHHDMTTHKMLAHP